MKDKIIEIENLIKSNKTLDALQKLQDIFIDNEISRNDVLSLMSRYENLQNRNIKGVISIEDYNIGEAKIIDSILQLKARYEKSYIENKILYKSEIENFDEYEWTKKPPVAIETFDYFKESTFRNYDDGIWEGILDNGTYILKNRRKQNAVKFHYLNIGQPNMADLPTTVEVQLRNTSPISSCGLMFCYSNVPKEYYAFTINNEGEYKLWIKATHGIKPIFSEKTGHITKDKANKIGFVKSNEFIYLFVNDKCIRRIQENYRNNGDSGIVAIGMGEFIFDNLSFYKL